MKPADNDIRDLFEEAPVNTNPEMDAAVLGKVLAAHDKTKRNGSAVTGLGTKRVIVRSPIARFAVAAAVVAAVLIGRGVVHDRKRGGGQPSRPTRIETLNLISLNTAYRHGGMEALEEQYRETFADSPSQPARLSVEELLTELGNGES